MEGTTGNTYFTPKIAGLLLILVMLFGGCQEGKKKTVNTSNSSSSGVSTTTTSTQSLKQRYPQSWATQLVDKAHPVASDFSPKLVTVEGSYQVDQRIATPLKKMLADCRKEKLNPVICSAYRSVAYQQQLVNESVKEYMAQGMNKQAALKKTYTSLQVPGSSEHNLGLAVDIVAKNYQNLDESQEKTKEQKWLMKNCYRYGFILRYPKERQDDTTIIYEPWHYRFVGKAAAKIIYDENLTLEEYLAKSNGAE